VTIEDRFDSRTFGLRFPRRLCAPADRDGGGMLDEAQHLTGYETMRTPFSRRRNLSVVNALGTLVLDVTRRSALLVPTSKGLTEAPQPLQPPVIDHFQCYRVKRSRFQPRFERREATVADQLTPAATETVTRPYELCVPASKNGEDPTAPDRSGALLCYKTRSLPRFGTIPAFIDNQFGPDEVTVIHRRELCVPSLVLP
jgi:hypothetical protein